MSDIFISYARQDCPRAEAIAKALEAQGWSVWWDRDIRAGETFRRVIGEAIDKARSVVVLWSEQSVDSDWVIEEASLGKKRKILIPALIDDVDLPLGFGSIQTADLTRWGGDATAPGFLRLCSSIAALIGAATRVAPALTTGPRTNTKDGLSYVGIAPGEFWMGGYQGYTDVIARQRVRITRGFWLGETPVTVAAYKRFARQKGRPMPPAPDFNPEWSKEDHPIVRVTWDEATAYCEWAGGKLPTEAQWEYAARAGKEGLKYPWGNTMPPESMRFGLMWKGTSPVRTHPANGWGLCDMAGNVWEWVANWYDGDDIAGLKLDLVHKLFDPPAPDTPVVDPTGPDWKTGERVLRGSSLAITAFGSRASCRQGHDPAGRTDNFGFRCACEVVP